MCLFPAHVQKFLSEETAPSESAGGPSSVGDEQEDKDGDDKDSKKKKNRCAVCRKKVGLTGKCGLYIRYVFVIDSVFLQTIRYISGDSRVAEFIVPNYIRFTLFLIVCETLY